MSEAEEESSEIELHENQCGVILGYWDHEKTPTLIQELETSVSLIEEKCKKLLEELIYYKKYLEESGEFSSHFFGSKTETDIPESLCRSETDIVIRKNFINSPETRQIFEEKFQQKLSCINQELTTVAQKIGLKNNIVLFPTNDYRKTLFAEIENEAEKSWCAIRDNFIKGNFLKLDAKPDSEIGLGKEVEFSKITKNELDLYLKLSRLNMKRRKCRIRSCQVTAPKGRKIKVGTRWKIHRFRQNLQKSTLEYSKSKTKTKKFKKRSGVAVSRTRIQLSRRNFPATVRSGGKLSETENEKIGNSQGELFDSSVGHGMEEEGGVILGMQPDSLYRARDVDSFATQLLHLRKRKSGVRVSASEILGGKAGTAVNSFDRALHVEKGHAILRVPSDTDTEKEPSTREGSGHLRERLLDPKGDFWMGTSCVSSTFGKVQSMYTCSWPEAFPERRKPNTRRCNDGRRSLIKSRSKRAQVPGSKITISEFQRADNLGIGKKGAAFEKASGDGCCKSGHPKKRKQRIEACAYRYEHPCRDCDRLKKLNLRKPKHNISCVICFSLCLEGEVNVKTKRWQYDDDEGEDDEGVSTKDFIRSDRWLKRTLISSDFASADKELKSLEDKVDSSLDRYEKLLQFYSKFLYLNKSLGPPKNACEVTNNPVERRKGGNRLTATSPLIQ